MSEGVTLDKSLMMRSLRGEVSVRPPVWLMRQAGRYLPEYRELRAKTSSFLEFCYSPKMSCEATLQPIRRFGFDAAILFSDILVMPDALGQRVSFETGEGPKLEMLDWREGKLPILEVPDFKKLSPVFEAVGLIRSTLPKDIPLIGFCGAPWTVACYMIGGEGSADHQPARMFAYEHRFIFNRLIDRLTEASIEYLSRQIQAGVNIVQVFDSWSGLLPISEFQAWCIEPLERIAAEIRLRHPRVPLIAFPRGAGSNYVKFGAINGVTAVGLDTTVDIAWAASNVSSDKILQGNLDPLALLVGGDALHRGVELICSAMQGKAHIFNLGHGILPGTPIENVEKLMSHLRR